MVILMWFDLSATFDNVDHTTLIPGLDWPLCHGTGAPFDEHRRPLAPYW